MTGAFPSISTRGRSFEESLSLSLSLLQACQLAQLARAPNCATDTPAGVSQSLTVTQRHSSRSRSQTPSPTQRCTEPQTDTPACCNLPIGCPSALAQLARYTFRVPLFQLFQTLVR